jgi:hypothetical protein
MSRTAPRLAVLAPAEALVLGSGDRDAVDEQRRRRIVKDGVDTYDAHDVRTMSPIPSSPFGSVVAGVARTAGGGGCANRPLGESMSCRIDRARQQDQT